VPPAPAPASLEGSSGVPASLDHIEAAPAKAADAPAADDGKAKEAKAEEAKVEGDAARARRAKAGYVLEVDIHEGRLSGRAAERAPDSERSSARSEKGEHSRRGFTPTARKAPVLPRGLAPAEKAEEKARRSRHYSADTGFKVEPSPPQLPRASSCTLAPAAAPPLVAPPPAPAPSPLASPPPGGAAPAKPTWSQIARGLVREQPPAERDGEKSKQQQAEAAVAPSAAEAVRAAAELAVRP